MTNSLAGKAIVAPPLLPFLKWAGGKRWFAGRLEDLSLPKFKRYVEPFLGSGALYFALQPKRALLADVNERLIETYVALRDDWRSVRRELVRHQGLHGYDHYYAERERRRRTPHARAAQFIYLNRTCWNGLYRVNRRGEFNVPLGTKASVLLDSDEFENTAEVLRNVDLRAADFEDVLADCGKGDFVFIDPPYTVKHNMNGFVKYNETLFSWADQVRLRDAVVAAMDRGADFLMTNADHASVRNLYKGLGAMRTMRRSSVLSGDPVFRSAVSELVVTTWGER